MKKALIIQVRAEDEAADEEYGAFLRFGDLIEEEVERVRAEQHDLTLLDPHDYTLVIVGGGPFNISDPIEKKTSTQQRIEREIKNIMQVIVEDDLPYFGACYGLGILADTLNAPISKEKYSEEVGAVVIEKNSATHDRLLDDLPDKFKAFVGHKEAAQALPEGCVLLASSASCPIQMIRAKKNIYGLQFHPELDTDGLILRINTYKYAGYFKPEEADSLIKRVKKEQVTEPTSILKKFIDIYHHQI